MNWRGYVDSGNQGMMRWTDNGKSTTLTERRGIAKEAKNGK